MQNDPIYNAIYNGIKRGIKVALDNKCFGSALILTYAGMDMMATLAMPSGQAEVQPLDFINWAKKYVDLKSKEKVTGVELYGARCGVVHNYGVKSRKTVNKQARMLGYTGDDQEGKSSSVVYAPNVSKDLVLVNIGSLVEAFFTGIDKFLIDQFSDPRSRPLIETRLQEILCTYPYSKSTK
jgi:hypothetical protein